MSDILNKFSRNIGFIKYVDNIKRMYQTKQGIYYPVIGYGETEIIILNPNALLIFPVKEDNMISVIEFCEKYRSFYVGI